MLVFQYALGFVVAWQLIEDMLLGQWRIYSGEYFRWRQYYDWAGGLGFSPYWLFAGAEAVLLVLYFARVNVRLTAALIALLMFMDGLGSFLNHRLLMAIQMLVVSLCPVPESAKEDGYRGRHLYWNLDLIRWQIAIVYLFTVYFKMNSQFLSGRTLQNQFFMAHTHEMQIYPEWLFNVSQIPSLCLVLAWFAVTIEVAIGFGMQWRRLVGWILPVGLMFHLGIALTMPFIWIFTTQVLISLIVFLPDRVIQGGKYRVHYAPDHEPLRFLRTILWPGYTEFIESTRVNGRWYLELPDGRVLEGFDARVELLSLSPATFLFAEMLRIAPVRAIGCRLLPATGQ